MCDVRRQLVDVSPRRLVNMLTILTKLFTRLMKKIMPLIFLLSVFLLWLRSRASVLLLEGCWFSSPGLHAEVSILDLSSTDGDRCVFVSLPPFFFLNHPSAPRCH